MTDELLCMIKSIDGVQDKEKIASIIKNQKQFSMIDSRAFRAFVLSIQPSIDLEQEVTCPKCGEVDLHQIIMTTEFFWPSL